MDFLKITFPVSGVTTWLFLPPLVAFFLAFLGSMAGVTGAFLLIPFQVSILGFTSPAVSATNFVYNIFAIPLGAYRFFKEGRMFWPLALIMSAGCLPGIFLGYLMRIKFLPDPHKFKIFVGCVLFYLAFRIFKNLLGTKQIRLKGTYTRTEVTSISWSKVSFAFARQTYQFDPRTLAIVSFLVGLVGGTYGIGGGALLAPFLVSILKLPIYTTAGATLFSTWVSSIAGAFFYQMGWLNISTTTAPDWLLGSLFGIGGMAGTYLGARVQKYFPEKIIKLILGIAILIVAFRYLGSPLSHLILSRLTDFKK